MPQPSDLLQSSSSQNSLHSSSSSVPLTSSIPSLSVLRIGGPNAPTSPSIDSSIVSNATTVASQNLQFKDVLEYDKFGRLRIVPYCDGFIPAYAAGNMVIEAIKIFFKNPWNNWLKISYEIKIVMWKQFMTKCS